MANITQTPDVIDLKVSYKDDFNFIIYFHNMNLTNYIFYAVIEWATGKQVITVNNYDLANGKIEIEITKEQLKNIPKNYDKTWSLVWTRAGKSREVITGKFN